MRDTYCLLENVLTYQGHSKICGCAEDDHQRAWRIVLTLTEDELREILKRMTEAR